MTLIRWNASSAAAVLGGVLLFAASACGPSPTSEDPADPPDWNAAFDMPGPVDLNPDPKVLEINLEAKLATHEFKPGVRTEVWTYNGLLPGPLLRAKVGDRMIVHFVNHLPEATTIHWHGVRVPATMDGSAAMQAPVEPGGTFTYDFTFKDAGTFWYHPHVRSSHQVNDGLYGQIIVEDPAEPALGSELDLVLSDVLLDEDGSLASPTAGGDLGDYFGREGNVLLVNGRVRPRLLARAGRPQEWRIVNASRARYYWFKVPSARLFKVGSDGGRIPAPIPLDDVLLTPGERIDLVVVPDGRPGDEAVVQWLPYERGYETSKRPSEPMFDLAYAEDLPALSPPSLPDTLRALPWVDTAGAGERTIELTETNVDGTMQMGIDGVPSWDADPLMVMANTTEVWTVRNTTEADHPFHLHGFFFQVLDVGGVPTPYPEWRDMQNVPRKQSIRIAVPFDDRKGMWMFHCHILDHAEIGMMGMIHLM